MLIEWAGQFDMLAQGHGLDQWGDIIILLVMAALWLAGVLAKVLTGKKRAGQQQPGQNRPTAPVAAQRESWQQRLVRKAREFQEAAEAERRKMEQETRARTSPARPRPAAARSPSLPAGEVAVRTDRKGDSVMVYQPSAINKEQEIARQREARDAILAASQRSLTEPSVPLETLRPSADSVAPPSDLQPLLVIDYSDPDALKKAVLHYEILGKPLALRDPPGDSAAF
ncbi:MAG: hypothetical protein ABFE01_16190 [Phycisphaerales bacterium]